MISARHPLAAVLVAAQACAAQPSGSRSAIAAARTAWNAGDLGTASSAYARVLESDTSASNKLEAAVSLANAAWRIRRDTVEANRYLALAFTIDSEKPAPFLEQSRMYREWHRSDDAIRAAETARARSGTDQARFTADVALESTFFDGETDSLSDLTTTRRRLAPHIAHLREMLRWSPGIPTVAMLLVGAGALAADSATLMTGWHEYFLVGVPASANRDVEDSLARALGRSLRTRGDVGDPGVTAALVRSRLFAAAALVARGRDASADTLLAYCAYLRAVGATTDDFYRATARGEDRKAEWHRRLDSLDRGLWRRLGQSDDAYSENRLRDELRARFGTVTRFTTTGKFSDLNFGHVLAIDSGDVVQYGRHASFSLITLDGMVSNGYLSWFWDGRSATGGWNSPNAIVQVRPVYAAGPPNAWRLVSDASARARNDSAIRADSIADVARATTSADPVYLPSVVHRLARAGQYALYDSLASTGLRGDSLENTFIRTLSSVERRTVVAHEGRHALDRRAGFWLHWMRERATPRSGAGSFAAQLEFTAKLSEIALSPDPRLAFGSIMAPSVGDGTPHGQANARVLRGIGAWMTEHSLEIAEFNPRLPPLTQLPNLRVDQLRAAARSLDPLAPR